MTDGSTNGTGSLEPAAAAQARTRILNRLKRLEGQVRGLQRMVEEERSCQDVLTLLTGIRSALTATGDLILEEYVQKCSPGLQGEELEALLRAVRLARS